MTGIELPGAQTPQPVQVVEETVFFQFGWALQAPPATGNGNPVYRVVFITPDGKARAFLFEPLAFARFRKDLSSGQQPDE